MPTTRKALIRLAASLPVGSDERGAVIRLAGKLVHKPGDVWKTDSGNFRGMGPSGVSKTFPLKEKAETYAKGKGEPKEKAKGSEREEQWADEVFPQLSGKLQDAAKNPPKALDAIKDITNPETGKKMTEKDVGEFWDAALDGGGHSYLQTLADKAPTLDPTVKELADTFRKHLTTDGGPGKRQAEVGRWLTEEMGKKDAKKVVDALVNAMEEALSGGSKP